MESSRKPETVLVSRLSALGDVAMTLPTLYSACRANPSTRFVMLTKPLPARMFMNAPDNLTVLGVDFDGYKGPAGIWRLCGELCRDYAVGGYVDLHNVLRTRLLRLFMRLRGVRVTCVDKGRREKKALCRRSDKRMMALMPMTARYRDTFRRAGIGLDAGFTDIFGGEMPELSPSLPVKEAGERWLAVAPFAAHEGKVYPLPLMESVVDEFASRPGYRIFIFGAGEKEREMIDGLVKGRGNVVSMAELHLGLEAELSLMAHCDVMLSMDSANMHLASLVGLRTVSIWGATHPFAGFMGAGQKLCDAIQLDMVCRPCSVYGNRPCRRGDYHCLNGISPRLVVKRLDTALGNLR